MGVDWFNGEGEDMYLSHRSFGMGQMQDTVARLSQSRSAGLRKDDPISFLLDADPDKGGFTGEQCRVFADRLQELMAAHPESREDLEWFAQQFVIGARTGGVAWSS